MTTAQLCPRRDADAILGDLDAYGRIAQAAHTPDPIGWYLPIPLSARRLLPPFPVDALPDWLAEQVAALAEFTQTPSDLPGCLALAALSAACGGTANLEVRPGWREPVNLYVVVALPPGSRKSAVFAALTAPLLAAERDLTARARPLIVEAEIVRKVAVRTAERLTATAASGPDTTRVNALAEASDAAQVADRIVVPALPRLVADDVTPEAAASLLAEQGGRLAVLSAEGGIFGTLAGRYSGAPNFEVFLKGHSGDLLRVDRKGRPAEHIDHPALTLGLAVQPEVLTAIAAMPGFRGRGLLARILYALPENTVGRRRIAPHPVPPTVAERYSSRLAELVRRHAEQSEPAHLTLDPLAHAAVIDLETAIEPRLGSTGDLAHLTDWAAKLVGAVARIAALLHLADNNATPVLGPDTIEAASRIGHYFLAHALAAFDHMGADPVSDDAQHILDWIIRTGTARFTRRELFSAMHRGRFRKVTDLDPALDVLDTHGHIRREYEPPAPTGPGRRPSPAFLVHPKHASAVSARSAEP